MWHNCGILRTIVELPDELLAQAKSQAALAGLSLKEFFIEAVESRVSKDKGKVRRPPPAIGNAKSCRVRVLTPEQIDEATFS